jgi:diguanylate cyclase (GGDEF)-like protein
MLRRLVEGLQGTVEERTAELERTHDEYERAHAELEAVNDELQKLLREQERLQAELAYRALHDPLTGLANRSMFGERLDQAFKVGGRGAAVLWIDLDDFKAINDIFGHEVGDELLIAVADRLREIVRETDDIARMGGDEFAIVLPNVAQNEARMVGQRVLDALIEGSVSTASPSQPRCQLAARPVRRRASAPAAGRRGDVQGEGGRRWPAGRMVSTRRRVAPSQRVGNTRISTRHAPRDVLLSAPRANRFANTAATTIAPLNGSRRDRRVAEAA